MKNKTMSCNIKKIFHIIWILFGAGMFFLSFINLWKAEAYSCTASLYHIGTKLSMAEVKEIYKENINVFGDTFVMWGEEREAALCNRELNRYCKADHIEVCGQVNILFADKDVSYFPVEDKSGCIIDKETAFSLFGDRNAEGKKIEYNGKKYIIRSIVESKAHLFFTQAGETKESIIDTVTMKVKEGETAGGTLQKMKAAFTGFEKEIDFIFFIDMANIFLWILITMTMIGVCIKVNKDMRTRDIAIAGTIIKMSWVLVPVIIVIYLLFCIEFFYISLDNIPSQWSDYDYWTTFIETKKENLICFLKMPKRFFEMKFMWSFVKMIVFGTIGSVMFISVNQGSEK